MVFRTVDRQSNLLNLLKGLLKMKHGLWSECTNSRNAGHIPCKAIVVVDLMCFLHSQKLSLHLFNGYSSKIPLNNFRIFPYKDIIYNSVLIWENTSKEKPYFYIFHVVEAKRLLQKSHTIVVNSSSVCLSHIDQMP